VNIGSGGHVVKEYLREAERKSITHCVNEDVRSEEGESIPSKYDGADRLSQERETWPRRGENPGAGGKVEKVDGGRMEVDVEPILFEGSEDGYHK
jgi:hypothetical protein